MSKIYVLIATTGEWEDTYHSNIFASFDKKVLEDKIVELEAAYQLCVAIHTELTILYAQTVAADPHPAYEIIDPDHTIDPIKAEAYWDRRYRSEDLWNDTYWKPKVLEFYSAKGLSMPDEIDCDGPRRLEENATYSIDELDVI